MSDGSGGTGTGGKMMERTCKNCMYEYGRLLPNPCGECSFVDNDRFIPKDDEVKKMFKSEIIKFEQLSGENAEITSISRIGGFLDGYHKAMEKPQWVSCSERMPEENGDYLVCYEEGYRKDYGFPKIGIAPYEVDAENFGVWTEQFDLFSMGSLGAEFVEIGVDAWMPLPEPYKEDADG